MIVNNLCISRYIKVECFDFYTSNQIQILNKEKNIIFRNLSTIKKNKQYDFAIIIDVLHHIGIDNSKKIIKLIKNLKKKLNF
jgi:superfamily II DNA or RNA helicase